MGHTYPSIRTASMLFSPSPSTLNFIARTYGRLGTVQFHHTALVASQLEQVFPGQLGWTVPPPTRYSVG